MTIKTFFLISLIISNANGFRRHVAVSGCHWLSRAVAVAVRGSHVAGLHQFVV